MVLEGPALYAATGFRSTAELENIIQLERHRSREKSGWEVIPAVGQYPLRSCLLAQPSVGGYQNFTGALVPGHDLAYCRCIRQRGLAVSRPFTVLGNGEVPPGTGR